MRHDKKIFYGWWVASGLFFTTFFGGWGRMIVSTFAPAMAKDTGWATSQIMLSLTITLFVNAVALIFVGRLIDTLGGKRVITIGSMCLLVGLGGLFFVRELWQLYLVHGLALGIAVSMLHFAAVQGVARKWFIKRAALVAGVLSAAFSISQAVLAPILTQSAVSIGWRTSSLICASFGVIVLAFAMLVVKDTPEAVGLRPYGAEERDIGTGSGVISEVSIPVTRSLRTPSFWLLCLAMAFSGIPIQGFFTNIIVWGADITGDPASAGLFVTAFSAPAIFGKIMWGWLGDKLGKRKMGILSSALSGVIMLAAGLWVGNARGLYLVCILFGFVYSGTFVVVPPYLGDLFGRASVGTLTGYAIAAHTFVGAAGPFIWGTIFDATGTYNTAALASAGAFLPVVIGFILARPLANTEMPRQ